MIIFFIPLIVEALRFSSSGTPIALVTLPPTNQGNEQLADPECIETRVVLDTDTGFVEVCPTSRPTEVVPGQDVRAGYMVDEKGSSKKKVFVKFYRSTVPNVQAAIENEKLIYKTLEDASYALKLVGEVTSLDSRLFRQGSHGSHALPGLLFQADDYVPIMAYMNEKIRNSPNKAQTFDCIFHSLLKASVDIASRGIKRPFLNLESVYLKEGPGNACPVLKIVDFSESTIPANTQSNDSISLFLQTLLNIERLAGDLQQNHKYENPSPDTMNLIIATVKAQRSYRPEYVADCNLARKDYKGYIFQTWCGVAAVFLDF